MTKVGVMVPHPKLARDRLESARISILYTLLVIKIATTLNPEISEDEAIDKMAQLQKGAHRLDNDLQIGTWKYSAVDGVIILGFGAERVLSLPAGEPAPAPERTTIHRGNALACRERADMVQVVDTILLGQRAYMNLVAGLLVTGSCTQLDRGTQNFVLERYAPKDLARVWRVGDTNDYWVNGMYAKQ